MTIVERLACPEVFQSLLTRMCGVNRFGDPMYKLVWGQSDWMLILNTKGEYERRLTSHNLPCWVIMKWSPPEAFGTPSLYYSMLKDDATGLCLAGEYPTKGRYEIVLQLLSKEIVNGNMLVTHFPLSVVLIEKVIPLIQLSQDATWLQKQAAVELAEEKEKKAQADMLADAMQERLPSFYGPVSYAGQRVRTSMLAKKEHEIQQAWNRMSRDFIAKMPLGAFQGR